MMIKNIKYVDGKGFDPYLNLALEEYLMQNVKENECILYLWQNENTIVIGRNQNPWKECKIHEFERDGGHLVRRLSGGGAVYHDQGNLNFTFLIRKQDYDVDRQLEVIVKAVRKLGIKAEKSGRNDITVSGRKFSGNAFYTRGDRCYHHGTMMVNSDLTKLSGYLQVSKEKLKLKGVDSVRSRVTNLSVYHPDLNIDILKEKLIEAFEEVYGQKAVIYAQNDLDQKALQKVREKFSSWEWLFGRDMKFQYELSKRFIWGNVDFQFQVNQGVVRDIQLFSDSMDPDFIDSIPEYLKGCRYENQDLTAGLSLVPVAIKARQEMKEDLVIYFTSVEL